MIWARRAYVSLQPQVESSGTEIEMELSSGAENQQQHGDLISPGDGSSGGEAAPSSPRAGAGAATPGAHGAAGAASSSLSQSFLPGRAPFPSTRRGSGDTGAMQVDDGDSDGDGAGTEAGAGRDPVASGPQARH